MPKISNKQLIDTIGTVIQACDAHRDNEVMVWINCLRGLPIKSHMNKPQVGSVIWSYVSRLWLPIISLTTRHEQTNANNRRGNAEWAKQIKPRNGST